MKMRQHVSVLMLFARSSIYKVAALLAAMTAVECGLFYYLLQSKAEEIAAGAVALESMFWWHYVAFMLSTILLAVVLMQVADGAGSKVRYTLHRLSIPERQVVLWNGLYNFGCVLLLWMVQAVVALGLCVWYTQAAPEEFVNHQTVALAFSRSTFLHRLIPRGDIWSWVLILVTAFTMGLMLAWESYSGRWKTKTKKLSFNGYFVIWWMFVNIFDEYPGTFDLLTFAGCGVLLIIIMASLCRKGVMDDAEKPEEEA